MLSLKKDTNSNNKNILVIRLDEIGDYILFRNYLKEIKNHYPEYGITLLGNNIIQDLAEHFDSNIVDDFIWIDKKRYKNDRRYIRKINKLIKNGSFEVMLSPVYSREVITLEPLISRINIKEKVGFWGDLTNINAVDQIKTSLHYSHIIKQESGHKFEFLRNKEFFEKHFNKELSVSKPYFELKNDVNFSFTKGNYAVVFPGSKLQFKQWSIENYSKVVDFISEHYDLEILLVGSPADKEISKAIEKQSSSKKIINITGRTFLKDLPYIFDKAEFVLSGDTCAHHFAIATDTKAFCISNGHAFCRFHPYPSEITANVHYAYHPKLENYSQNFDQITEYCVYTSILDINDIKPETVIKLIKENYS